MGWPKAESNPLGLVRTVKLDVEAQIQRPIPCESAAFAWLVEHAADTVTKFQVGVDGLTPYQRLTGKPYSGELLTFGSLVHHRAPGKPKGGSMQPRWYEGIYLGSRFESQ